MKRVSLSVLIILCVPLILGMGSMNGEDYPDKIPVPEKKFSATFVDQMDVVTTCTDVSIVGKTFIKGIKGKGTYTIPFEHIKSITFFSMAGELKGVILLKNNSTDELILGTDHKAYGRTDSGTFQIGLLDLKEMILDE